MRNNYRFLILFLIFHFVFPLFPFFGAGLYFRVNVCVSWLNGLESYYIWHVHATPFWCHPHAIMLVVGTYARKKNHKVNLTDNKWGHWKWHSPMT